MEGRRGGFLPSGNLASCLERGFKVLGNCEGGAGAFLSSLERIRWRADGIGSCLVGNGTSFELGSDGDPKMLMRLARRDLEAITYAEAGLADTLSSITIPDGYHRASSSMSGHVLVGLLPGQTDDAQQH